MIYTWKDREGRMWFSEHPVVHVRTKGRARIRGKIDAGADVLQPRVLQGAKFRGRHVYWRARGHNPFLWVTFNTDQLDHAILAAFGGLP